MSVTPEVNLLQSALQFHRYQPGGIYVNAQIYHQPILCQQDQILLTQAPHFQSLTPTIIRRWCEHYQPELILVGTGEYYARISEAVEKSCHAHGVALDVMSTDDCMRTLVALQTETRRLLCLLTP